MIDTSLQPARGLGGGRSSRQQRVREVIGEARAALQETSGIVTPTAHLSFSGMRRWVLGCVVALTAYGRRLRPAWRFVPTLARHLPTLAVLLLLSVAVITQAFGVSIAYMAAPQGGEGGIPILSRGSESSAEHLAFAFAAAPMTMAKRQLAEDEPPPAEASAAPSENLAARNEVVTYTVQAGDTLDGLAEQFGIASYTIYWLNDLSWPGNLREGEVLTIPPISGVPHVVQAGETIDTIADMYGVRSGNIVGYPPNELRFPYRLQAGQEVFVPGGIVEVPNYRTEVRPPPTLVKMPGGEKLSWPTWGEITAPFGWSRGYGGYHKGLDIANAWGTPIIAAAAGTVIESGWGGLGWHVVIDHNNGFITEYGHMAEEPLVSEGDTVARYQRLGIMGRTYGTGGRATGVHLHFAVRHHGVLIDPLPLLER